METASHMSHYHANMAAFLRLAEWFDTLRAQGVYDNTRIILVSDHGYPTYQLDELSLDDGSSLDKNLERYFPLLMVKDFGAEGFAVSDTFMTVADVPSLAMEGLIDDPVNPYTGKPISMAEKTAHAQHIIASFEWDPKLNNGNTFPASCWLAVKDNIWDKSNWAYIPETRILTDYLVR